MRLLPILALVVGCGSHQDMNQGRALRFPPYPRSDSSLGGYLIQDTAGGTDYSVGWVRNAAGDHLWFSRLLSHDSLGKAHWLLLDSITVPTTGSTMQWAPGTCSIRGKPDAEIIALAETSSADTLRRIVRAWRASRVRGAWQPIDTLGLVCENEGSE